MITVSCHHQLATAAVWRGSINALNLASERPDPFSSFEFYEHCLRYPADQPSATELWLLLALEDGELLGCLALRRCVDRVLGWPVARLTLLTAQRSDRPRLVVRLADGPSVADAIYRYLLSRHREWSLLEFQQQDAQSTLGNQADVGHDHCCRQWPNEANASIAIRWSLVADYIGALHRKQRAGLQRSVRLLNAAGTVQCLSSADPALTPLLFRLYRDVERHSWKATTPTGFDENIGWHDYYRALLAADAPMRIRIDLVLLDGRPVAGLISSLYANSGYALHIVYDERHADLAPGTTMLFLGVQRAIAEHRETYHLLWGYGYYKRRWLAELTDTHSQQIYRRARLPLLRRQVGDLGRRLRGVIPQAETGLSNPARAATEPATDSADAAGIDDPFELIVAPGDEDIDDGDTVSVFAASPRQRSLAARYIAAGGESLSAAQLTALVSLPAPGKAARPAAAAVSR